MQTYRVIHANEPESLAKSLFKIVILIVGVSAIAASFLVGGANAYQAAMQDSTAVYSAGLERFELFPGFFDFVGNVVYFLKIFACCVIALAVSAVVLFAMVSLGVVGWLVQMLFAGFGKAAELLKSQWSWATGSKPVQEVVIGTRDGKPLMLSDFCKASVDSDRDLERRVRDLEQRMSFVVQPMNQFGGN